MILQLQKTLKLERWVGILGAFFLMLSVIGGAILQHVLEKHLTAHLFDIFRTGIHYLQFHGLALLVVLCLHKIFHLYYFSYIFFLYLIGIILFCFGIFIYIASLSKIVVMLVPLGGISFIVGHFLLFLSFTRRG